MTTRMIEALAGLHVSEVRGRRPSAVAVIMTAPGGHHGRGSAGRGCGAGSASR